MAPRQALMLCLLCLGAAGVSADVHQSDAPSPELEKCQFSKKELHTTVRSAAVSALTGICDPVEMESRLLGMEQRLKQRIDELKETLTKLFIEGVAYDYDEEGDIALEQHRYTGAASVTSEVQTAARTAGGDVVAAERSSDTKDGTAAAAVVAGGSGGATLTQYGGVEAYNTVKTAADARRTTSSSRTESERRTASSASVSTGSGAGVGAGAGAGAGAAGAARAQQSGSRSGSSHSYSYKWGSSSRSQGTSAGSADAEMGATAAGESADRRSSGVSAQVSDTTAASAGDSATVAGGAQYTSSYQQSDERRTSSRGSSGAAVGEGAQEARAIGGAGYSGGTGSQSYDAARSGSREYSYERRTSSSRTSSGDVSRDDAQRARAIGSTSYSEGGEDSQHYGSSRAASRRDSHERRTSSQGSSRDAAHGRSSESRAIGGAAYSRGADPQQSGRSGSSVRRVSQERTSSSRSSSSSRGDIPYVDFGPGGGPEQQSWFPGTSRTTAGTGVPDLPASATVRTGGFGFGAVGEPLDENDLSGGSSGAQVRAGGATLGDSEVLFRNRQRYVDSVEARRPGSTAGGDSSQYAAVNASWSSSGERQVTAYDASSASRPAGAEVRFSTSYTPSHGGSAYSSYNSQRRGGSSRSRSRQSSGRSRSGRRRATRRRSRITDTVSTIAGGQSSPLSRYFEIDQYNDTVYEVNGKQRYSYYWEVNDFRTMMATWEHQHSLRSPSFYVYKGGYKMYIRVFPSRQGGNVYLHTGLTQGRFDDQLPWPFEMRLRLSLLDHSNLRHDIRSRIWDPRKLCSRWNWQRPRRNDNFECVGLGFPQGLLETRRFLLNGAVLIKLEVFLED